jgi:hypothetical protein
MDGKNPQHTGTFHGWKMTLWGEKATDSPIKEIELSSRNTTGDIKPKIEIHGTEKNEDPASNIENDSVKNISIYQNIMDKLALLKEKLKMLQKADSILKEQETEQEKIEEQQKDVSFGDIKGAEDPVETADQPLKEADMPSKNPSDKNTLEVEHHEASTPKLDTSNEPTKLGNTRINQLKSDINTQNALMPSNEKSAFESTHVSILFFALLIMTIVCIVFIFKKYVVVSDKLVSYMNGSSQNSYELRELLIQQNENDLNSSL